MPAETAFWDTSAIIPLCCDQDFSAQARRAKRRFSGCVIWWGTPVEVHSAIFRLNREGILTDQKASQAIVGWQTFHDRAGRVRPEDKVRGLAISLTGDYSLRTMDAFQLAAALVWCSERPRNRPFICADQRLGDAASDAGFDVVSLI